jgi:hypothetical protein
MKRSFQQTRYLLALALAVAGACSDPTIPNLNDPVLPTAIDTRAQLQAQVSGLLAGDREQHAFTILVLETMGRDLYRIDPSDPRYLQMPLGTFSPSAFLVDFTYNAHYRTIRGAQSLIDAVESTSVLDGLTFSAADKAAARGYARTMLALQYLRLIETRDTLGLPIVLGTGGTLDPIRCKPAVLAQISSLLDAAYTDLKAGGASFPFSLGRGFIGNGTFNTPATFATFNRGLAAKILTYRGFRDYRKTGAIDATNLTAALAALGQSFASEAGSLRDGVYHVYTTSSGDLTNFLYNPSVYRANPRVLSEAETGDARLSKVRNDPLQQLVAGDSTVKSSLLITNITGPLTPMPIVTNAQLLLERALIQWGLGNGAEALRLANLIRTRDGGFATPKLPFVSRLDLLRFILQQKRYSLLLESGDRLVDYRMFGLFSELGLELATRSPGEMLIPFPQSEIDARNLNVTCQQ